MVKCVLPVTDRITNYDILNNFVRPSSGSFLSNTVSLRDMLAGLTVGRKANAQCVSVWPNFAEHETEDNNK
jgi:hypothetical protein